MGLSSLDRKYIDTSTNQKMLFTTRKTYLTSQADLDQKLQRAEAETHPNFPTRSRDNPFPLLKSCGDDSRFANTPARAVRMAN